MQQYKTMEELKYQYDILKAKYLSLELAQTVSHMGSWEVNLKTHKTIWSKETYCIYKQDPKKYFPTLDNFFEKIIEKDRQKAKNILQQLQDGKIHQVKLHALRGDNRIINILMNAQIIFNKNHTPKKIIGTTFDITELTQIKVKQQQQSKILDQIHDSVISIDLEGIVTYYNNGAVLMHGYTKEDMIGHSIYILYPPDEINRIKKMYQNVLNASMHQGEITKITKSGKTIYTEVSLSLLKDEDESIIGITIYSQDITKRKQIENELKLRTEQLNFQAFHDELTKLPNRALFYDRLGQSIIQTKRNNQKFALLFIDLDNFKQINDSLGHHVGDGVLKNIAKRLQKCIREQDTLSRLGGDEFTIILQNIKNLDSIAKVAQKIINITKRKIIINKTSLYISASIGISLSPQDSIGKDNLIKFADSAMYHAKRQGRSNYQFYSSDMTKSVYEKIVMENSLRSAIRQKQLVVFYQPQMNAKTDKLIGTEALVRWQHPTLGLIPPIKFIPLAEESNLIVLLDNYVMKQAMKDYVRWYNLGLNPGILSLNLSTKLLHHSEFINYLIKTLQETKFHAKWLEFEITETQIIQNQASAIEKLTLLSNMGIKISIDDFGTGYSSLTYLKRLPINKLKIDKSFIDELPHNEEDCIISKTIISLARNLNLEVLAEGVETKEQKDFLVQNNCYLIQGYLYSRPISSDKIKEFIQIKKV